MNMTIPEIEALFVGRTITKVDISFRAEFHAAQVSSITLDNGTKVLLGGEHDCAYVEGKISDEEGYAAVDLDWDIDEEDGEEDGEEDEEEIEEDEDAPLVLATLRELLPPEYLSRVEGAGRWYAALLDCPTLLEEEPAEWPVASVEKEYVTDFWVVNNPDVPGGLVAIGICSLPWRHLEIIFAKTLLRSSEPPTFWWRNLPRAL
jgi:hypothetical protein